MEIIERKNGIYTILDFFSKDSVTNKEAINDFDTYEKELQSYKQLILNKIDDEIKKGNKELVMNLLQVTYIHSGGLGVLSASCKKVQSAGGHLYMIVLNQHMRDMMDTVGLSSVIPVYLSEEEFIKAKVLP